MKQGQPRSIIKVINRKVGLKPKGRNNRRYKIKGVIYLPKELIGKKVRIEVFGK